MNQRQGNLGIKLGKITRYISKVKNHKLQNYLLCCSGIKDGVIHQPVPMHGDAFPSLFIERLINNYFNEGKQ